MAFLKSKPNLPDQEKARIEYYLERIAACIGFDRFQLPILSAASVLGDANQAESRSVDQIMSLVGEHLRFNTREITIQTLPLQPQKKGGGG